MTDKDLELVYFPLAGRAKPIRLVFAIGGIPFKDTRINFQEYGAMIGGGQLPLETLPILKMNGRIVSSQSGAILRYAAALSGLDLKGADAVARGEDIAGTIADVAQLWSTWFRSSGEDKANNAKELVESGFPFYGKRIEKVLSDNTSGPYTTDSLSFVDILLYCVCGYVQDVAKSAELEDPTLAFPRLRTLLEAVSNLPQVQAYE